MSCIRSGLFSLEHTLECGQFFRFTKVDNTYIVQASGQIFSIGQRGDLLIYEGVEESFLIDFFRLDEKLGPILKEIDRDPIIHRAIQQYPGLRLIRQDPWECLISYLCSSAKTIPHIRILLEGLCKSSGRRVQFGDFVGYQFPEPFCIQSSHLLELIGVGFRARYLREASRCIDRGHLLALKGIPYPEARQSLMKLAGVGKKVADCILLYSLDFLEAFPMDTWIRKGVQKAYFRGRKTGEKKMEDFVSHHFGPYGGYAQLYLYHYWRNHRS